jgi:hypothetical protein
MPTTRQKLQFLLPASTPESVLQKGAFGCSQNNAAPAPFGSPTKLRLVLSDHSNGSLLSSQPNQSGILLPSKRTGRSLGFQMRSWYARPYQFDPIHHFGICNFGSNDAIGKLEREHHSG